MMITESHLTPGAVGTGRGDAVIETTGLTRYFGARKAVDGLTMAVPRGSVFAFLGRNGSGKTTTIRMLLGLTEPTRGSSRVLGEDSQHLTPEIRARVGYMSESHSLYKWWTVRECGEYQSRFYPRWNNRIFQAVTDHFHLNPKAKAGDLSRGERAGLSLAITLAPEPELLILDDPALGLDPVARRSLLESMIRRLKIAPSAAARAWSHATPASTAASQAVHIAACRRHRSVRAHHSVIRRYSFGSL